jgi:hypothetical protein
LALLDAGALLDASWLLVWRSPHRGRRRGQRGKEGIFPKDRIGVDARHRLVVRRKMMGFLFTNACESVGEGREDGGLVFLGR